MPKSPAISAIGSVVDAPVRRTIKDWMGPARSSAAAVVASPEEAVVVSAEAVVVSAEAVVVSAEDAVVSAEAVVVS